MRVIATAVGYDNKALRQPGDEFEMPDGMKGSWFEPKDPPVAPPARKGKAAAQAPAAEGDNLA